MQGKIKNTSAAGFFYDNVWVGQTPKITELFGSIFAEDKFDRIIEIGTYSGGLPIFLKDHYNLDDVNFHTFDITGEHISYAKFVDYNLNFYTGDCFDSRFGDIKSLIKSKGRALLLCDGGNKAREFEVFSEFLKSGDVIMCHDFAESMEDYTNIVRSYAKEGFSWTTSRECELSQLIECIDKHKLQRHHFDLAKSCFWGCFKKL